MDQVLGESGDEDEDELDEDGDAEFAGEEALLLKNSSGLPRQYALKNGSVISDLSASIRARMKGQFMPIASDDILMLNRGAATGVSSRLWDTQVYRILKIWIRIIHLSYLNQVKLELQHPGLRDER